MSELSPAIGEDTGELVFSPILGLDTKCSTPAKIVRDNIAYNKNRDICRLHTLPMYGKYQGGAEIAIVGGGPSLIDTMDELRGMKNIMACGSSHDFLVSRGIYPRYAVMCDADKSEADFVKNPILDCIYFVASCCDPSVFDALEGYDVAMWDNDQGDHEIFAPYERHAIQGGCTVTLKAINIAIMIGFIGKHHFFGFDSSFTDSEYAYEGNPTNGRPLLVKVNDRIFKSTTGWLAQAVHFRDMVLGMPHFFTPTVHGDGLIAAMMGDNHE